jgi:hypothetical protein
MIGSPGGVMIDLPSGPKPIEFFLPRLANVSAVKVALRKGFGNRTPAIIAKLKKHQPLADDELGAMGTIDDLVQNKSEFVKRVFRPEQSYEHDIYTQMFINVSRFRTGGRYLYWFSDEEGERTGYFTSLLNAKVYAQVAHWT